jgi:hypothetical protein
MFSAKIMEAESCAHTGLEGHNKEKHNIDFAPA